MSDEAMFLDLCRHARREARAAVLRVAKLAPRDMIAGVMVDAAQGMTLDAAMAFATAQEGADIDRIMRGIDDPLVCQVFVAVARSWALAPDSAAAELQLRSELASLLGVAVEST